MKYSAMNESEVMKSLVRAILCRAVTDVKSKLEHERINAMQFVNSEYCELMCGVIGKEYSILLRVAIRSYRKANNNE